MTACQYPGCLVELPPRIGRGGRFKRCPEHAKARKREQDKARPKGGRIRKTYPQCCLDAQAAKVRAYKGGTAVKAANVRKCAQHRDWRIWYRLDLAEEAEKSAEDNDDDLADIVWSQRFRITPNHPDNYLIPDPEMQVEVPVEGIGWDDIPLPSAISGYDVKAERMTRRYLALAPDRQAKKAVAPNTPEPSSDLGYWRDKCAEGRKWHKTDAFLYPPEMNRGAGWCAK